MILRGDPLFGLYRRAKSLTSTEACRWSNNQPPSIGKGDYPWAL